MSKQEKTTEYTQMNIVHEISRLNNEGLQLLISANKKFNLTARRKISQALTLVNHHAASVVVNGDSTVSKAVFYHHQEIEAALLTNTVPVPGLDDECLYIHQQGFVLDPAVLLMDPSSTYNLAAAAILFNLGLACHQYGIQHHDHGQLHSACRVYELCTQFSLIQVGGPDLPEAPINRYDQYLQVVSWAALNNQSQIMYQYLDQKVSATDLLHRCLAPAIAVATTDTSFHPSNFLTSDQVDEIILNMVMMSRTGWSVVASPAA